MEELDPVACPCGKSRRAFTELEGAAASLHLVEISKDAKKHFHKEHAEIYLVLEGEGYLEIDEERIELKPMTSVYIFPGCRHRAVGNLKLINISLPKFDSSDEWFD